MNTIYKQAITQVKVIKKELEQAIKDMEQAERQAQIIRNLNIDNGKWEEISQRQHRVIKSQLKGLRNTLEAMTKGVL